MSAIPLHSRFSFYRRMLQPQGIRRSLARVLCKRKDFVTMVAQWLRYSSLCWALVQFSVLLVGAALATLLNLLIESQCTHRIKGACGGVYAFCLAVFSACAAALGALQIDNHHITFQSICLQYLQKDGPACPWAILLELSSFALVEWATRCIHESLFVLKVFFKGVCILVVLLRETANGSTKAGKISQKGTLRHSCYSAGSDSSLKYQIVVNLYIVFQPGVFLDPQTSPV